MDAGSIKDQAPAQITNLSFSSFLSPLNMNRNEQTLAIGEDSQAVNVVGVAVIDLYTFARHQPPSDTRVIAAREELSVADHC